MARVTSGNFLVTGGSSGLGASIAARIAADGRRVGILTRRKPDDSMVSEFRPAAGQVDWIEADLTRASDARSAIQGWCDSVSHRLDGVVLSAVSYGYGSRHPVQETVLEEWDCVMAVNLRAQYVTVSAVLPALLSRRRAFILSISSIAAIEPAPGRAAYAASKAGSLAFFRALAEELRDTNVSVIQVMPKNQIVTPGLRARRPPGFSFENYDSPEIFSKFTSELIGSLGRRLHGSVLTIGSDGRWEEVRVGPA